MSSKLRLAAAFALTALAAACGGGGGDDTKDTTGTDGGGNVPVEATPRVPVAESRDGTVYHQPIESSIGETVTTTVFEPKRLEVGQTYPLVLHGHGYGGARTQALGGFIQRLVDAGYYVISFDQRGFGESDGTSRSMSPDFDGQNLIAILDWAENLEGLRRRENGQMMVGSMGGSYGGMYQFLLLGADPQQRLRVLAPDITPHDLVYALAPHDVIKSGWVTALSAVGEQGSGGQHDDTLREMLLTGTVTNTFDQTAKNFFTYHSVRYFCDGLPAGPQSFVLGTPDPLAVPPRPFAQADMLITQGFRDTLFNFNDGLNNFECARRAGGDVRLLTHQSGHILPVNPPPEVEDGLDPFYAALTLQLFQDAGGSRSCGGIDLDDAQFAWFEEKLQGKAGAIDTVITSGRDVCISLAEGDAIAVSSTKIGGAPFTIDASIPQFNSVLGPGGEVLGNGAREALLATQIVTTVPAGGAILAGVPTASLEITGLSGLELEACPGPIAIGGCDPILFLALGHRKAGMQRFDIVDDQITPIRHFGAHELQLNGVAERLAEGDQIALLVYGFHAQFPITWSRDVFVPAANLAGTVSLPFVMPSEVLKEID
jgi:ABC-2 type transport system ATP-binding protein